ncbi:MAG: alpha/beta fold hydrolase [Phycisphaerae bacterium]|nr:alpha/beta fold hydrolase [Phycisphaerae bacterium]
MNLLGGGGAPFYGEKADLLYWLDESGARREVSTAEEWGIRRGHVLSNMQAVMGAFPDADRGRAPEYEVLEEKEFAGYVRKTIRYEAGPGDRVSAFLFLPRPARGRGAAMLCLHPTSPLGKRVVAGEGERPNRNYGSELAERGYVVLAPDYPGFGDDAASRKRLYEQGYVSCTMKGIWNHMRGVDLVASLEEVDAERIGCIGHSLGGHNALFAGVFDSRLRVVVTSCGFTTFSKYKRGDLTGWTHDGYMPRIADVYGKDPARMPFDFTEVLGAIAPRGVFVSAPLHDDNFEVSGVLDAVAAARAVYGLYGAEGMLRAMYPEAAHDFPDEARRRAYSFVDVVLRGD